MSALLDVIAFVKSLPLPFLPDFINRKATNLACSVTRPRPRAFSLWSHVEKPAGDMNQGPVCDFTSWPMLIDRSYSARHLPPVDQRSIDSLPNDDPPNMKNGEWGEVTNLFSRDNEMTTSRSSALFMFFAQWFTDSVLRIHPEDRRKNTSNHNIDLCQIYGLTEKTCRILRLKEHGKLRSQIIDGEEFPDSLGDINDQGEWQVKSIYTDLPYANMASLTKVLAGFEKSRWQHLYATGLERGNSSIGYVAISTLFLREHNRLCGLLSTEHPDWDDERLFQTARMINTVLLMKLIVEEYINHIAGNRIFHLDISFAENEEWYRTPWISLEFDMLYRWHGLVPDSLDIKDKTYDHSEYRVNNQLLQQVGLGEVINAASTNPAGAIGLLNTPNFLLGAEFQTIKMGRDFRLGTYNDYRRRFGLAPIRSFNTLTQNSKLGDSLSRLYSNVEDIEFIVGLFAEQGTGNTLFGDLMYTMVAYDAFTQIYTNPLLSRNVCNAQTFSEVGMQIIKETNSLHEFVSRNISNSDKVIARFDFR